MTNTKNITNNIIILMILSLFDRHRCSREILTAIPYTTMFSKCLSLLNGCVSIQRAGMIAYLCEWSSTAVNTVSE